MRVMQQLRRSIAFVTLAAFAIIALGLGPLSAQAGSRGGAVQYHGAVKGHYAKRSHGHGKRSYSSRRHYGKSSGHRSGRRHAYRHHRKDYGSGSVSLSRSGVSLGTYGLKASGGSRYSHHRKHGHKGKDYRKYGRKHGHRKHRYGKRHYGQPSYAGHYYGGSHRSLRRIYKPSTRYYSSSGALIISVGGSYAEEETIDSDYPSGNAPVLEKGCAPGEYCTLRLGGHSGAPKIITRNQTGKPIN